MMKYGKVGRDLTIYSAVFMYSGNMFYITIMQYAIGSQVDENNRTIRMLVYPTYSGLFDVQRTPIYEIVYILQCTCTFMLNTVTSSCCGLAALFATHACGQIDVIMSQLNDLADEKFSKKNCNPNARLMEIVQHHIRILKYKRQGKANRCPSLIKTVDQNCRFSAMIETVLQEVCFFEFVGSTFLMCVLQYNVIVVRFCYFQFLPLCTSSQYLF